MDKTAPPRATGCPVCDSQDVTGCVRIADVPIYCNVLYESREAALAAPTGDIDLVFCSTCGHLFNVGFDPHRVDYTGNYENSLHYSGRFKEYAASLARHLVERHDLRGKTVIEIACGQGDFLQLLCSLGVNQGIGFDPSHAPGRSEAVTGVGLTFIQDYYSEAYADQSADLICCRHALEHIDQPGRFLRMVRRAIGDKTTAVFFEVPNALFTLDDLGIWDIIYEHCGYFTDVSLREVFQSSGFRVMDTGTEFGGQFLYLHGAPAAASKQDSARGVTTGLADKVARFARVYSEKVESWQSRLQDLKDHGRHAVLWGAGSKGVSFLNTLKVSYPVDCLIDLNPHKHGRYIPGTGHQVRSPETLVDSRPDTVIVMNPLYADEIGRKLRSMGVDAEIIVDEKP